MHLTLGLAERLILRNQYLILKHLDPAEAESYEKKIRILEDGYELEYSDLTTPFSEKTMSEGAATEVIDILDMYSALQSSHGQIKDRSGLDADDLEFPGFDGNDRTECDYMGYARFLVKDRRFASVVLQEGSEDFNSHSQRLGHYRQMLERWKKLKSGIEVGQRHRMTKEQILEVLGKS